MKKDKVYEVYINDHHRPVVAMPLGDVATVEKSIFSLMGEADQDGRQCVGFMYKFKNTQMLSNNPLRYKAAGASYLFDGCIRPLTQLSKIKVVFPKWVIFRFVDFDPF